MAKSVELLLVESVENLGIVGDVVKVRLGYARNFLMPRSLATVPSDELIKTLQAKRAVAQKEVAALRKQREETIGKLAGFSLELIKSSNDQGVLYGQITQQDVADALTAKGHTVRPRDVRLSEVIKRVGEYEVLVKYETELETRIKLFVKADRELEKEEKNEMDFDEEGNLITPENPGKFRKPRKDRMDRVDSAAAIDAALNAEKSKKEAAKAEKAAADSPKKGAKKAKKGE